MSVRNYFKEACDLVTEVKVFIQATPFKKGPINFNHRVWNDLENRVDRLAKEVFFLDEEKITKDLKANTMNALSQAKRSLVLNQSHSYESTLQLNTLYHIPSTTASAGYNYLPQVPIVSAYGTLSTPTTVVRLDKESLSEAPEELRNALGDLKEKKVDCFYAVLDTRWINNLYSENSHNKRLLNVCVHRWAYPDAQPLEDLYEDVDMGIFPLIGIQADNEPGGIAVGKLSPMHVHAHPLNKDSKDLLYSPDNAHFKIDTQCPVQVMWVAAKRHDRVLVTKLFLVNNYENSLGKAVVESFRECPNLDTYLTRLQQNVPQSIETPLATIIHLFEKNDAEALTLFNKLPNWQKKEIYKHIWILHGRPMGVHHDFGQASFLNKEIDPKFFSNDQQRAQAIKNHIAEMQDIFVASQGRLFSKLNWHTDEEESAIYQTSQMFENDQTIEANESLNNLFKTGIIKAEDIFNATWQLNGFPKDKGTTFGRDRFTAKNCSNHERAQVLLLASQKLASEFKVSKSPKKEEDKSLSGQPTHVTAQLSSSQSPEPKEEVKPVQEYEEALNQLNTTGERDDILLALDMLSAYHESDKTQFPHNFKERVKYHLYFHHLKVRGEKDVKGVWNYGETALASGQTPLQDIYESMKRTRLEIVINTLIQAVENNNIEAVRKYFGILQKEDAMSFNELKKKLYLFCRDDSSVNKNDPKINLRHRDFGWAGFCDEHDCKAPKHAKFEALKHIKEVLQKEWGTEEFLK